MSGLPGIARLFFPTAESAATVTIVAEACVREEATRRTTRKAGTVAWKNRLTPRPTFIPRPTQASGRYLGGRSTRRRPGVTFSTCEHVKLIWPRRRRTSVRRLPVWVGGARPPSEVVDVRELVQWRRPLWRDRRGGRPPRGPGGGGGPPRWGGRGGRRAAAGGSRAAGGQPDA